MDLVDEYLRAVAALLPKDQREDIIAELRDPIIARIEDRESGLGRTLTGDEIEAILREIGHPLVVATRYRGGPQHVVGPALYPFWFFVVKVTVLIQAAGAFLVMLIRWMSGGTFSHVLGEAISAILMGAITLIGLATAAAWLIEQFKVRLSYLDNWRVRDLRIFEYAGSLDLDTVKKKFAQQTARPVQYRASGWPGHDRPGSAHALAVIAWGMVFILWWVGALGFGLVGSSADLDQLGLAPGALAGVAWSDLKDMLFWPILGIAVGGIVRGVALLAYPRTPVLRGFIDILVGGATVSLCVWLWAASPLAPAIQVDSVSQLVVRVKTAFQNSPPFDLAPLFTVFLTLWAVAGITEVVRGLWLILTRPTTPPDATLRAAA